MGSDVTAEECLRVGADYAVGVEMLVVDDGGKTDVARFDGFEREDSVIDGAEYAVGDEDEGEIARRNIVNGEEIIRDRHHQSPGTFDEHHIVALKQGSGGAVNDTEVYFASVDACGKLCGCGIGEDDWGGRVVEILGERVNAHQTSVEVDVFREACVAGLDKFLGDYAFALLHQPGSKIAGDVAFAGVSVDA